MRKSAFGKTLERGLRLFEEAAIAAEMDARTLDGLLVEDPLHKGGLSEERLRTPIIRPGVAFYLHDTYGFPIDLTRIMAEERDMGGRYRRLRKTDGAGKGTSAHRR